MNLNKQALSEIRTKQSPALYLWNRTVDKNSFHICIKVSVQPDVTHFYVRVMTDMLLIHATFLSRNRQVCVKHVNRLWSPENSNCHKVKPFHVKSIRPESIFPISVFTSPAVLIAKHHPVDGTVLHIYYVDVLLYQSQGLQSGALNKSSHTFTVY